MKYRPINCEVEAVQWKRPGDHPNVSCCWKRPDGTIVFANGHREFNVHQCARIYALKVAAVWEEVKRGDWIVTNHEGKVALYTDRQFKARFALVEMPQPVTIKQARAWRSRYDPSIKISDDSELMLAIDDARSLHMLEEPEEAQSAKENAV